MDVASALWVLHLFNEKADKLLNLSFTEHIRTKPTGYQLDVRVDEMTMQRYGPTDEATDAFVLTLRFFVQNNEPTSFQHMGKMYDELHDAGLLPESLAQDFGRERDSLNTYLNLNAGMTWLEESYTHRRIFKVFLWGGLAHANKEKKATYDKWQSTPLFASLEDRFVSILKKLLLTIAHMRELNESAIEKLQA